MTEETKRNNWDAALSLKADKMPLQNLDIENENLKYYLTHQEYNILLSALQSLINDYESGTGGGGGDGGSSYWDSYTVIKEKGLEPASDSTLYTSLRVLEELRKLKEDIVEGEDLGNKFLSRINPDSAEELITFLKGISIENIEGKDKISIDSKKITFKNKPDGFNWEIPEYFIDSKGYARLKGLILDEYLEVPDLRYNRIEINVGDSWRAPGGGVIETVNQGSTTGKVYLKLDEGELGAISVNDLCMGIFHFMGDGQSNATQDIDTFSEREIYGFSTSYFKITNVSTDKKSFDYELRTVSDPSYNKSVHPQPGMHFVGFGNTTNVNRQTSSYQTRTYQRYLTGRDSWHYTMANIAAQFGDLSTLPGDFSGYSAYLNNVYFSGNIEQLKAENISVNISDSDIRVDKDAAGRYILSNTSTSINIYEGIKELTPLPVSTEENLTLGTYFITTSGTNITPGNSSIEGNLIKFSNVSSMLSDIARITYHITVKRTTGEIYKLAQTQKISYLKGEPGEPGEPGDSIDHVVFSYAFSDYGETPPYNDTNINWISGTPSVTAEHKGKFLWIQTKTVYTGEIPTSYTYSVSYIPYDGDGKPGEPGEPGVSIVLSRDNHTYTFYSVGDLAPKGPWSDGKISLSVYRGSKELVYSEGLSEDSYTCTFSPLNITTSTNSGKLDFYPTALPADIIFYTLNIGVKVDGVDKIFTKTVSYSRLNDGVAGVGVPIVFRGDWNKDKTFYGNNKRMDITKHSNHYWKAKNISGEDSSTGFSGSSTEPKESSEYWERFGAEFESVATSLLLAEKANIAEFAFQNQAIYSQNGYMIDSSGNYTEVNDSSGDLNNPLFKSNLYLNGKTGELQARTGYIGGFTIHKDMLQSTHGTTPSISLNGRTGAGHLAGKNIMWDSAGKVTFGDNVSLSWNSITGAPDIPDGVSDAYIKGIITGTITDEYITEKAKASLTDEYINSIITPERIDEIFKSSIEDDFITTIKRDHITTAFVSALKISALGAVTAGSFSLGNGTFAVDDLGSLTATKGTIGGFNIDEDSLQSTHKTTIGAIPSILLNGSTGAGHLAGRNIEWDAIGNLTIKGTFESNNSGNRIVIDPVERALKMINDRNYALLTMDFTDKRPTIYLKSDIAHDDAITNINNREFLLMDEPGNVATLITAVSTKISNNSNGNRFNVWVGPSLMLELKGLPTSSSELSSGAVWRDSANGNVLKIVP